MNLPGPAQNPALGRGWQRRWRGYRELSHQTPLSASSAWLPWGKSKEHYMHGKVAAVVHACTVQSRRYSYMITGVSACEKWRVCCVSKTDTHTWYCGIIDEKECKCIQCAYVHMYRQYWPVQFEPRSMVYVYFKFRLEFYNFVVKPVQDLRSVWTKFLCIE